jgi:hypothetical protein
MPAPLLRTTHENSQTPSMFGGKKPQEAGENCTLRSFKMCPLHRHCEGDQIYMRWGRQMKETRNACKILNCKPNRKTPLRKPRTRREDNINMKFKEVGHYDVDCIRVAQNRGQIRVRVNTTILRVPQKAGNLLTSKYYLLHKGGCVPANRRV